MQGELYKLMTANPDASIQRMVEIAAEKGMTVTSDEVRGFLRTHGGDPKPHTSQLMACALVIAFTVIGMLATHSEQTSLNRIEEGLQVRVR